MCHARDARMDGGPGTEGVCTEGGGTEPMVCADAMAMAADADTDTKRMGWSIHRWISRLSWCPSLSHPPSSRLKHRTQNPCSVAACRRIAT
jgi:hypothetical protein